MTKHNLIGTVLAVACAAAATLGVTRAIAADSVDCSSAAEWQSSKAYKQGDQVRHDSHGHPTAAGHGRLFQCRLQSCPGSMDPYDDTQSWTIVGECKK